MYNEVVELEANLCRHPCFRLAFLPESGEIEVLSRDTVTISETYKETETSKQARFRVSLLAKMLEGS